MLPSTLGIIIMMNRLNTRVDTPPHRVLMSGKQGRMHLITPDLVDLRVLEVIPDQAYLISPQTQRWFITIITTTIIIQQKDLPVYTVIRPPPLHLLLEVETWEKVGVMWVDHLFHLDHRIYMQKKGGRSRAWGQKVAHRHINPLLALLLLRMIGT
jgi:hypothetical protein